MCQLLRALLQPGGIRIRSFSLSMKLERLMLNLCPPHQTPESGQIITRCECLQPGHIPAFVRKSLALKSINQNGGGRIEDIVDI